MSIKFGPHMTATCNLTERDCRAFRRHVLFRYRKVHWWYGAMLALVLALSWLGGKPEETLADKILLLIGGAIIFGGAAMPSGGSEAGQGPPSVS